MAGSCVAGGLTLDGDGNVVLSGYSSKAWPHEATCHIATKNGLHVDPGTGHAWVAPDLTISTETEDAVTRNIVPTNDTTKVLSTTSITHTAGPCTRTYMSATVSGGYQGFRIANGNFWIVRRTCTMFVNGVPVYTTGGQVVGACENNVGSSGDALSIGGPIDSVPFTRMLNPGDVAKITASYQLELPAYVDDPVNGFTYRSPWIVANFFTVI